jgi:hypothetical protein
VDKAALLLQLRASSSGEADERFGMTTGFDPRQPDPGGQTYDEANSGAQTSSRLAICCSRHSWKTGDALNLGLHQGITRPSLGIVHRS